MDVRHRRRAFSATLVLACGLAMTPGSPASARIVESGTFHDEFSGTIENFCDAGIDVSFEATVDGRFRVNSRGPGGFDYYHENVRVVNVYTDVATGQTATDIQPGTVGKDQSITENPDGTLTIVVLFTGGARTYGDDGKLIAKNSGQVRFENVIDAETGEEISSELIFGSTGTNDDFCEAVLADWGYS